MFISILQKFRFAWGIVIGISNVYINIGSVNLKKVVFLTLMKFRSKHSVPDAMMSFTWLSHV